MGNKESSEINYNENTFKEFCHKLIFEREIQDPRYGDIKIYVHNLHPNKRFFVVTKKPIEDDYDNFIYEVEGRRVMEHPNLLKTIGYLREFDNNVCGTTRRLAVYSEWHKHTLERELMRRASRKVFEEYLDLYYLGGNLSLVVNSKSKIINR